MKQKTTQRLLWGFIAFVTVIVVNVLTTLIMLQIMSA